MARAAADPYASSSWRKLSDADWRKRLTPALHDGHTGSRDDIQPLITAAMAVVRSALAFAGGQDHFSRLRMRIAKRDVEPLAES